PEIAGRILNYRLKGGRFKKPEDLRKIFGINVELVKSYEEYMIIPKEPESEVDIKTRPFEFKREPKKMFVKFDLNDADTTTFQTINGIGPYWSKRLVSYRESLGGFVDPKQVYELYGLDEGLAQTVVEST